MVPIYRTNTLILSHQVEYAHLESCPPTHLHAPLYTVHPTPCLLVVLLAALQELSLSSTLVGPEPNELRVVRIARVQVHDTLCLCWALAVESALSVLHGKVL